MYTIGSNASGAVDRVFLFIVSISVILLLLVTFLMIFFAVKYSRSRHPRATPVKDKPLLEILWTVIPTILVLAMFFYGYEGFKLLRHVPDDALVVHVTGRMWDWSFEYENGKKSDRLYVPVGESVKLILKSADVIHSFYIPTFRVKEDVLPNRETYLWFKPQTTGPADIFCAEYCGERHAFMLSQVIVMEREEFTRWLGSGEAPGPQPADGEVLAVMERHDCLICHSLDDSRGERLSLRGVFGREVTVVRGGETVKILADEAYLKRAILEPGIEVVLGQSDTMPVPEGLTEEALASLIDLLKTLK
jgi:cytochrome c oxidase subunit 2